MCVNMSYKFLIPLRMHRGKVHVCANTVCTVHRCILAGSYITAVDTACVTNKHSPVLQAHNATRCEH
jgi:hypothetical protein